jgi:hypothetical protein
MNNEQLAYNNETDPTPTQEGTEGVEDPTVGGEEVTTPEGTTPEGDSTESGRPSGLAGFLAVLSPKEKKMLLAALARLAESERLREEEAKREEALRTIAEMDKSPVFAGIASRADAIFALCRAVPWLSELPTCEQLSAAYYIDRGMRYGEPTKEDLLRAVLSDGELQAALEEHRHKARKRSEAALPPVSSRRGTGRVPATVKAHPKTLAEASEEAKKYLRFYK